MGKLNLMDNNLYSRCAAGSKSSIFLGLKDKSLDKKNILHTRLAKVAENVPAGLKDWNRATAGICVLKDSSELLVVVGADGEVLTLKGEKVNESKILPKPVEVRAVNVVDGEIYACGSRREVYVRNTKGKWEAVSAPKGKGAKPQIFEAIAGFNRDEVYAVGWGGEIWERAKGKWIQHESPVNKILTGICVGDDGLVYICGQDGTVLKGRHGEWSKVGTSGAKDDFWDILNFKNKIYVASMSDLYCIEGTKLKPVDFGKTRPESCYKLTANEDVMWSMGQQNLFSFDGKKWQKHD